MKRAWCRAVWVAAAVALAGCQSSTWVSWPDASPGALVLELAPEPGGPAESVLYLERPSEPMPHVERELRVDIASEGDAFAPPLHVVRPGDEVQFVNRGALVHRLFIADVDGRSERAVNPGGASAAFEITRAGEHRFYCSLHPHESFTVFASPSDRFVVPDGGSSYRFDDLPAGRYRLRWWSEAGLRSLGSVEIREGETETRAISLGEAPQ